MLSNTNTLLGGVICASLLLAGFSASPQSSQELIISPPAQVSQQTVPVPYEQVLREEAEASREPVNTRSANSAEINCLARNIYYEARGEGVDGMRAVAHVTMNRMHDGQFRNTICGVVHQPSQFSWVRQGYAPPRGPLWARAQEIAERVYTGQDASDNTHGATYFHAFRVRPSWANRFKRTTTIGGHAFYRT